MITQSQLKAVLSYDPVSGIFKWLMSPSTKVTVGALAGYICKNGYRHIKIHGKPYLASRLAHLYMNGSLPDGQMDHRDCDPGNDAWENLRSSTASQNQANKRGNRVRLRGSLKGACFYPRTNRWKSSIQRDGHNKHLGYFDTEREAHDVYVAAANALHGEFARAA